MNRRDRRAAAAQGRNQAKPKYPLVACDHHKGDPLPGYVVCTHLAHGTGGVAKHVEHSTKESVGVVLCAECATHKDLPADNLVTACAHFVNERFGVPL